MNRQILAEDYSRLAGTDLPFEKLRAKRILITGATGFFPAYLTETLLTLNRVHRLGLTVHALCRSTEKAKARLRSDENLKLIIQDVNEPVTLNEKFDLIIHAASPASPKYYGTEPVQVLLPNTLGTYLLLERAKKDGAEFLYFSSSEIYGALNAPKIKETDVGQVDPFSIRACYAESKRLGETMCMAYAHQYSVPIKVIRPFHTYGPGMDLKDGRVFADFVGNVVKGQHIELNSDGSAVRAYCYLEDAIRGLLYILLKAEPNQVFNLGNDEAAVSILDLATTLVGLFPEKKLQVVRKQKDTQGYLRSPFSELIPDTTKLRNLGWKPQYNLAEGFRRTIESYL